MAQEGVPEVGPGYFHSDASHIALDHFTFDGPLILSLSDQLGYSAAISAQQALRCLGVVMMLNCDQ